MKRRTILGLATGALVLATAAAIPVLDLDHPDARDLASWIEVDDPPAHLLEPVPTDEGLVVPKLAPRSPPVPKLRHGTCGPREAFALVLTVVPEAPPAVPEPEAPSVTEASVTVVLELPPLRRQSAIPAAGVVRAPAVSCSRA